MAGSGPLTKVVPPLSRTFTFKADAEQWARQTEAAIERGECGRARATVQAVTLLDLLTRYEQTVTPSKKGIGL